MTTRTAAPARNARLCPFEAEEVERWKSITATITQTPVLTNSISMKQMDNSNDWFVAMSMYQKFARVAGIFGNVSVIVTLGFIGWDGYKLAKILNSET